MHIQGPKSRLPLGEGSQPWRLAQGSLPGYNDISILSPPTLWLLGRCVLSSLSLVAQHGSAAALPAKLSCISWRDGSSQIRDTESKTQMCKKPTGQVLARLCSWLVHRQFISQDSSWVGCHVAVGGSDSSADFPGEGLRHPWVLCREAAASLRLSSHAG